MGDFQKYSLRPCDASLPEDIHNLLLNQLLCTSYYFFRTLKMLRCLTREYLKLGTAALVNSSFGLPNGSIQLYFPDDSAILDAFVRKQSVFSHVTRLNLEIASPLEDRVLSNLSKLFPNVTNSCIYPPGGPFGDLYIPDDLDSISANSGTDAKKNPLHTVKVLYLNSQILQSGSVSEQLERISTVEHSAHFQVSNVRHIGSVVDVLISYPKVFQNIKHLSIQTTDAHLLKKPIDAGLRHREYMILSNSRLNVMDSELYNPHIEWARRLVCPKFISQFPKLVQFDVDHVFLQYFASSFGYQSLKKTFEALQNHPLKLQNLRDSYSMSAFDLSRFNPSVGIAENADEWAHLKSDGAGRKRAPLAAYLILTERYEDKSKFVALAKQLLEEGADPAEQVWWSDREMKVTAFSAAILLGMPGLLHLLFKHGEGSEEGTAFERSRRKLLNGSVFDLVCVEYREAGMYTRRREHPLNIIYAPGNNTMRVDSLQWLALNGVAYPWNAYDDRGFTVLHNLVGTGKYFEKFEKVRPALDMNLRTRTPSGDDRCGKTALDIALKNANWIFEMKFLEIWLTQGGQITPDQIKHCAKMALDWAEKVRSGRRNDSFYFVAKSEPLSVPDEHLDVIRRAIERVCEQLGRATSYATKSRLIMEVAEILPPSDVLKLFYSTPPGPLQQNTTVLEFVKHCVYYGERIADAERTLRLIKRCCIETNAVGRCEDAIRIGAWECLSASSLPLLIGDNEELLLELKRVCQSFATGETRLDPPEPKRRKIEEVEEEEPAQDESDEELQLQWLGFQERAFAREEAMIDDEEW